MSADNGERAAASIPCESSDGLVRKLLCAPIAGDCEQPIAPRCHKYRRFRHGLPSLAQLSRAIGVVEQGHAVDAGARAETASQALLERAWTRICQP